MSRFCVVARFAFLIPAVLIESSGVPGMSSAISGIVNDLMEGSVPHYTNVEKHRNHSSRLLGQSCQPNPVTGLQFCSVLNGMDLTSTGSALAKSLDIELGTEFQFATSVGFQYGDFSWTLPDNNICRSAFASYACLDGVEQFHCINGVSTVSGVCQSTCQAFLSRCSQFTPAQIYSVCADRTQNYGCTTGMQQSSAVLGPIITAKKPGDKCTAQTAPNMASCAAINGLELTQDGLTVATGVDLSLPEIIQSSADSLVDTPACRAALTAMTCIRRVAPYRCIGGVQTLVTPCPPLCTNYLAACTAGLSASQIASACAALASTLPTSTACSSSTGAIVATSAAASARARWSLSAVAIVASICAAAAYAAA
jgi:hypothetical protein